MDDLQTHCLSMIATKTHFTTNICRRKIAEIHQKHFLLFIYKTSKQKYLDLRSVFLTKVDQSIFTL